MCIETPAERGNFLFQQCMSYEGPHPSSDRLLGMYPCICITWHQLGRGKKCGPVGPRIGHASLLRHPWVLGEAVLFGEVCHQQFVDRLLCSEGRDRAKFVPLVRRRPKSPRPPSLPLRTRSDGGRCPQ